MSALATLPAISPQTRLGISVRTQGTRTTVLLDGELHLSAAPKLARTVGRLLRACPNEVVVDVRGVRLCSARGLSSFLGFHSRLEEAGVRVALRGPNPRLGLLFELYGLKGLLVLHEDPGGGSVHRAGALDWPATVGRESCPTARAR